jgi:hypothetical protein
MKIRATAIEPAQLMINNNLSVFVSAKGLTPVAKMNVSSVSWIAGKSAYQVWLDAGNIGTQQDFLDSLKGAVGGSYTHNQLVPATVWTVTHNLGYFPNITVVDSTNREVIGSTEYIDLNTIQLTFSGAFSGKAYAS